MKTFRFYFFCLLFLSVSGISAQVVEKVLDIFAGDSLSAPVAVSAVDSDSVRLTKVQEELAAVRLNEANLRMEIEQMKLTAYAADSVKRTRQKQRIDSLRQVTQGVPVIVDDDTLFYFYAKRGGHTPQQRAENVANDITALGKRFNLKPDSLYIESSDIVTDVMYDNKVIVSFTDQDGLWGGCTRDQLLVILEKLKVMKEEHGFLQLCKRVAYFVLVLVGQFLLFWGTNWLFRRVKVRIVKLRNTRLKPFSIQDYELLDTHKQVKLLIFLASLVRMPLCSCNYCCRFHYYFPFFRRQKILLFSYFPIFGIR